MPGIRGGGGTCGRGWGGGVRAPTPPQICTGGACAGDRRDFWRRELTARARAHVAAGLADGGAARASRRLSRRATEEKSARALTTRPRWWAGGRLGGAAGGRLAREPGALAMGENKRTRARAHLFVRGGRRGTMAVPPRTCGGRTCQSRSIPTPPSPCIHRTGPERAAASYWLRSRAMRCDLTQPHREIANPPHPYVVPAARSCD